MSKRRKLIPANPGFSVAEVVFRDDALPGSEVYSIPVIAWEIRESGKRTVDDDFADVMPSLCAFAVTPDGRQDSAWVVCPDGKVISVSRGIRVNGYFATLEEWRQDQINEYRAGMESVVI